MKLFLSLLLAFVASTSVAQTMLPAQREALNAAEKWLAPVDAQRYDDAWAMAAESFKSKVTRDAFRTGMAKIRKAYGKLVTRSGEKMAFRGDVPSPEPSEEKPKTGTEIGILFDAKFAGDKKAMEEVTMVLEQDGIWRVAGYYIK